MGAELAASVRRLRADEWTIYRELRLRALAESPDAFGSTLELEEGKPDEHWMERVAFAANSQSQMLLVAQVGTERVGVALGSDRPGCHPSGNTRRDEWTDGEKQDLRRMPGSRARERGRAEDS